MNLLELYLILSLLALTGVWLILLPRAKNSPTPAEWPKVSIWVAARNEEKSILDCLRSLHELDYPKDRLQILVGNDQSEDRTAELVQDFIRDKPEFELVYVENKLGLADKKANVLAHLAHLSTGDYFLVCDADIRVNPNWARRLVSGMMDGTGVISGTTLVATGSLYAHLQRHDWLFLMGLLHATARLKIPCTAVGNNMGMSREAYWKTGGYENIEFSITEDYKIFSEIRKQGYGWKSLCDPDSTSTSAALADLRTLIKQRHRWLIGGKDLPLYWKLMLLFYGLFNPALLLLVLLNPLEGLAAFGLKLLLEFLILGRLYRLTRQPFHWPSLLLYDLYSFFVSILTLHSFLFPSRKEWKGRRY